MSINEYVRWTSFNPARKWDLYPQKGALQVGSDADITIVDLQHKGIIEQGQLHSLHKFSPWHGRLIQGKPVHTIVGGRVVVLDGELVGEPGWGAEVRQNRQPGMPRNVHKSTRVTVSERPSVA